MRNVLLPEPLRLAGHGTAPVPVLRIEQMRTGMLNVISIVYNEQGILFVGVGFQHGYCAFAPRQGQSELRLPGPDFRCHSITI